MNKYNALLGIGQYEDQPWLGEATATGGTSSGGSVTDKISSWLGLAKEGASIFQTVKSGSTNSDVIYNVTPLPAPQNNTIKYALIGGGALLAVGALILMSGRKKKALGVINNKAGKRKKK